MSVRAYVLVQTSVGKVVEVAEEIRRLPGVVKAEDVTGPYDLIVSAEASDVDELARLVASRIQTVAGITRTVTCTVVNI